MNTRMKARVTGAGLLLGLMIFPLSLSAQSEEELDQLLLGEGSSENFGSVPDEDTGFGGDPFLSDFHGESPFRLSGYAEFESGVSLSEDDFEENEVFMTQGKLKLKPSYEVEGIRVYGDIDFFSNSGGEGEPHEQNSLECLEAYVEGSGDILWKIGKQRFNWGVGDTYQPSNLIDRSDSRESVRTDEDDRYTGVYALSLKYLLGDYALELALRPVSEEPLPPSGFFSPDLPTLSTASGQITPRIDNSAVKTDLDDLSAALRLGGITGIVDWHVMAYSGLNRELLYRSALDSDQGALVLELEPVFQRMTALGADLSVALDRFNIRLEGLYSPDMPALESFGSEDIAGALAALAAGEDRAALQSVRERAFYSYSAGVDILAWGDYGTVYLEWMQARYVDEQDITPLLQTDILLVRLEDSWFDQALNVSLGSMVRTKDAGPGVCLTGEAELDFKNGLTMALGSYLFFDNDDEYMEILSDKDLIYLDMKYEY